MTRASNTLSSRLRAFNAKANKFKRISEQFYIEDLFIYSGVIIGALGFDVLYNVLHYMGFMLCDRPFNIGFGQLALASFFGFLLIRRISQWQTIARSEELNKESGA